MNWKIVAFVAVIVVLVGFFVWSGLEKPAETEAPTTGMRPDTPEIVATKTLPTIEKATVAVQNGEGEAIGAYELEPGAVANVEGTPWKIRMTDFYTFWNWENGPVNRSFEEENPAAKIEVLDRNGNVLYYQWAFKNAPFFRMSTHGGGDQNHEDMTLAFTLMTYEGLQTGEGS